MNLKVLLLLAVCLLGVLIVYEPQRDSDVSVPVDIVEVDGAVDDPVVEEDVMVQPVIPGPVISDPIEPEVVSPKAPVCPDGKCPVPEKKVMVQKYFPGGFYPGYTWSFAEASIWLELQNRHGMNAWHLSEDEAMSLHDRIHNAENVPVGRLRGLFRR